MGGFRLIALASDADCGSGAGRPVAIVCDDDDARRSAAFILAQAGYRVRHFRSGAAFFASCAIDDLAGIVLDIRLRECSGLDVLEALKSHCQDPPVVMLAGDVPWREVFAAMRCGVHDVIEKPVPPRALCEAVDRAAGNRERAEAARRTRSQATERIAALPLRYRQILDGLVAGRLNKQIAHDLGLSVRTVESYRLCMFDQIGARNAAEAVRIALESGLLGAPS
jgi:two-component system response regulator FixJ